MRKSPLIERQMSAVEYVERAAEWSRLLTRLRARGPGDLENAMRSIERDYGVDYWTLWRLRYRLSEVKTICASIYARLGEAYRHECERQCQKLAREITITETIAGADHAAVRAAKALVGEDAKIKRP